MIHTTRTAAKLATTLSLLGAAVCITGTAQAERVRHCDYTFNATVETEDLFANVVQEELLVIRGESAGKHGGIQANTARERARNRILSCVDSWNSMSSNLLSSDIVECTNANISGLPGFDVETGGGSLRDMLGGLLPGICAELTCSEEVLLRVKDAKLVISGDSGCPASRDYPLEEMLLGEFCAGL